MIYVSAYRWALFAGLQCSLIGQLAAALEQLNNSSECVVGTVDSSGTACKSASSWEHVLKGFCRGGFTWDDVPNNHRVVPLIISRATATATSTTSIAAAGIMSASVRHRGSASTRCSKCVLLSSFTPDKCESCRVSDTNKMQAGTGGDNDVCSWSLKSDLFCCIDYIHACNSDETGQY